MGQNVGNYPVGPRSHGDAGIWADVLHLTCVTCGVGVDEYCVLDVGGKRYHRHAPCIARLRAAERALEAS
jgi:hypothetical protein